MSFKSILVPTENHDAMHSALQTALLLARRCDSYIEGFALRSAIGNLVTSEYGSFSFETYVQDVAEESTKARQVFETFMQQQNVPRSTGTTGSLSYGWLDEAQEGESFVGSYGRVFDIIVMSRPDVSSSSLQNGAIESGLFESGRPVLISPPLPPRQIATNVLVAWNRSTEQARATALAMPLLQQADRVTILNVADGTGVPGPSAEQLVEYMQRNGVAAILLTVQLDGRDTGEAILRTADSLGCDLLIKGAYTQSRLRQMIFGGATRHVLANANLPVLLAH